MSFPEKGVSEIKSIAEQYEDASYSKFVESSENEQLYTGFLHFSFLLKISSFLRDIHNFRILDIGCGNAVLSRKIKCQFPEARIVGIDQSAAMLKEAARLIERDGPLHNIDLLNCNLHEIPGTIGDFDCVISGFVLAHMPTKESVFDYFRQVHKHLKPGGLTVHIIPGSSEEITEGQFNKAVLPYAENDDIKFIELFDFKWTEETYREASLSAGLIDVDFEPGEVDPKSALVEPLAIDIFILSARRPL